jgi:hypothetical protein
LGLFDAFKKKKRHQTEIGKAGENYARERLAWSHGKVERDPVGSDFKTTDPDLMTGKRKVQRYEVKVNNSRLSERQKQTKGLKVIRLRETPFGYEESLENKRGERLEHNYLTGRDERVPKARKNDPFGINSMLGMDTPRPRRSKRNDDPFSTAGMLGLGSSRGSKRSRRRSDDPFGLLA